MQSLKLYLNLCLFKWLSHKGNWVKNFRPWGLNRLWIDHWNGWLNANNLLLQTSNDLQFVIVESKLYQDSIVYGKNEFFVTSVLQLIKGLFPFLIL